MKYFNIEDIYKHVLISVKKFAMYVLYINSLICQKKRIATYKASISYMYNLMLCIHIDKGFCALYGEGDFAMSVRH